MTEHNLPIEIRFERYFIKGNLDECWLWTGWKRNGYGAFAFGPKNAQKKIAAHIFSYELYRSPIPQGMQVHHTCETRNCVNPWHMELLYDIEHKVLHKRAYKTHCSKGHLLTEDNLVPSLLKKGYRQCLICTRETSREYMRKTRYWSKIQ